jgi:hypothetical protein
MSTMTHGQYARVLQNVQDPFLTLIPLDPEYQRTEPDFNVTSSWLRSAWVVDANSLAQ